MNLWITQIFWKVPSSYVVFLFQVTTHFISWPQAETTGCGLKWKILKETNDSIFLDTQGMQVCMHVPCTYVLLIRIT